MIMAFDNLMILESDYVIIKTICDLKPYRTEEVILFINKPINDQGFIENTDIYLEEIIITLNIKLIICQNINEYISGISSYHKIPTIIL